MPKKRKTPVSDDQIVATYLQTKSSYKTAAILGVGETTVYRVLLKRNVPRDGLAHYRENAGAFDAEKCNLLRAEYEGGAELSELIERYGGNHGSVKSAIRRVGGVIRRAPNTVLSEGEIETIKKLAAEGVSQIKISLQVGRSQPLISRVVRKYEIPTKRGMKGVAHSMWKGGRWSTPDGYVRVWVDSDDLLACMRDKSGYILEHRLVMARSLGRPLDEHETVHHIDGNRTNNAIENLQLRQGRHGKGVVMRCRDCGSHNIESARLEEVED